jgi:hypothetical protein
MTVKIGSLVIVDVYTDGETHRTESRTGIVVAIDGTDVDVDTGDGSVIVHLDEVRLAPYPATSRCTFVILRDGERWGWHRESEAAAIAYVADLNGRGGAWDGSYSYRPYNPAIDDGVGI